MPQALATTTAPAIPTSHPPSGRVRALDLRPGEVYLAPSGRKCRYAGPHGRSRAQGEAPWFMFTYVGTAGDGFTFSLRNIALLREVRS